MSVGEVGSQLQSNLSQISQTLQTEEGKQSTYEYAEKAEPYQRFELTSRSRMAEWQLPSSLSLSTNSSQISPMMMLLEESILAHNPVPEDVEALKEPKADTYPNYPNDIFKTSIGP